MLGYAVSLLTQPTLAQSAVLFPGLHKRRSTQATLADRSLPENPFIVPTWNVGTIQLFAGSQDFPSSRDFVPEHTRVEVRPIHRNILSSAA
jgi:hypothetical protein